MSSLSINQGTNAAINFDLNGTINTQVVGVGYGTISTLGTLPNLPGGTLNNSGTTTGVGTITNLGSVSNIGTMPALIISSGSINGTVNIGNTPNIGTIGTLGLGTITGNLGTIGTLGLGTITGNLGTIGTLGLGSVVVNTLPNLPGGSVVITTGTIVSVGTIGTLGLGTITGNLGTIGTLGTIQNQGSLTNIGQIYNAGTLQAGTITTGSIIVTAGTQQALGTIGTLGLGTIVNNGGSVQFYDTSGSIANILTSSGTAAQQNSQLMAGAYMEKSFTTTSAQAVGTADVSNYKWVSIHFNQAGVGATATWQISNDNVNWIGFNLMSQSSSNIVTSTSSGAAIVAGPLNARFFRINVTGISSGTTAGVIEFYTIPATNNSLVGQAGGWSFNGTINAGTFSNNPVPTKNIITFGTAGTLGIGTLVGAPGVGTSIYVIGYSIDADTSVLGTPEVCLSFGTVTTGQGVFTRSTLITTNDPIIQAFPFGVNGGTSNSPLTYQIVSGAGSVAWSVQYFTQ